MISKKAVFLCTTLAGLALAGCGSDDEAPATSDGLPANAAPAASTYEDIVYASYQDSVTTAKALDTAAKALVAAPSQATLTAARDAWLAAREPYLQTEVYRFYEGPIDNQVDGPEGAVNAWPLDEAFIDYVEDDPDAGIVNDPTVTIDAETLESKNEEGSEENIATGFHAAEFLLWGQDLSDTGPGARPHTDYVTGAGGTAKNQDRRGTYLTTVTALLVSHLEGLAAAWQPGSDDNYRSQFTAAGPKADLERVLTGMIVLSGFETGGERLQTAYDTEDQEDEHSCFSDNTHRDMVQDVQGVKNVWTGRYTRLDGSVVSGVAIADVVRSVDPALADELGAAIDDSLQLANALQKPFDREIEATNTAGRARVQELITALRTQEELLQRVFRKFGLTIPVVE
jgi:putative iron-regulated protein